MGGGCWDADKAISIETLLQKAQDLGLLDELSAPNYILTPSSVLAWRLPGTAEPGGLPSMGSHRVGHD